MSQLTNIEIYSDGSGNSLDSDGGAGYVIMKDGKEIYSGAVFIKKATNNIAELTAAIKGLEWVKHHYCVFGNYRTTELSITLISDSQLVLNYAEDTWRCKKEHLKPYKAELQMLYNYFDIRSTRWVKGHSGHPQNEKCDLLAKTARMHGRNLQTAKGLVRTMIRLKISPRKADWIADFAGKLKVERDKAIRAVKLQ